MRKVSLGDLGKACFTPKPVAFQTVMGNKDVLYCRKVGLVKPRGRRPTEVRLQKKWAGKKDVGPRFKLNGACKVERLQHVEEHEAWAGATAENPQGATAYGRQSVPVRV